MWPEEAAAREYGGMTRFIEEGSPIVLHRLPSILAGDLSRGPRGVVT
jgi:hypothetical protein